VSDEEVSRIHTIDSFIVLTSRIVSRQVYNGVGVKHFLVVDIL
jgi:hypothetical protein